MAQPDVLVYSHEWHMTRSNAFVDLVIAPLQNYAHIVHQAWQNDPFQNVPTAPIIIFCQLLPPVEWLVKQTAKLIWMPMWDAVRDRPQTWWNKLPKSIHIVAFSKAVAQRAKTAGLPLLELQYFKNPADFPPPLWQGERILYYWNRRGIVSPAFLEKFCTALHIDRLLFRPDIDPYVDERATYTLPPHIGNTRVEIINITASQEDYWKLIAPANIIIAPRLHEGAGMVFLEALARGCAVFANNAPTMNEYIEHQSNGFLLRRSWSYQRLQNAVRWRLAQRGVNISTSFQFHLPEQQDWEGMRSLDLEIMGRNARRQHIEGYQKWQANISDYAHFIFEL